MVAQLGSTLQAGLTFNKPLLFALAGVVALFAIFFPATVRDADERKLPPNVTARILIVFIYLVTYLALVATFAFAGDAVASLGVGTNFENLVDSLKGNAPLLGITVLAGLHTLSYFRELESALVVWLHSARHLSRDIHALTLHLQECSHHPSPAEREKNLAYLRDFDIYVTDTGTKMLHLEAVNAWRKTSTLLRLLRLWNSGKAPVLSDAELRALEEMEKAHSRKTRLAMDIIRMLEHVDRGGTEAELSNIAALLAETSHKDRAEVSEVEARLKAIATRSDGGLARPVRITSDQLQQYLSQIESYFRVEYALLLQQVAQLAAKSVVLAGDEAPQRLEQMKSTGFGQLGRIVPVNFDRILWVFFAVSLGGFLILFLPRAAAGSGIQADLAARISIVMALAALIGAIAGSNRKLALRPNTPWSSFLMAGLISAAMFFLVHGAAYMLKELNAESAGAAAVSISQPAAGGGEAAAAAARPAQAGPRGFSDLIPWAVQPFLITIAICWLARLPSWPRPPGITLSVWERVLDGLALMLVMLVAQATAFALHIALDTGFATFLQKNFADYGLMVFFRRPWGLLLAYFIGALVVRDVRLAAHAQLTDPRALSQFLASTEAPVQIQTSATARPDRDAVVPGPFGAQPALSRSG